VKLLFWKIHYCDARSLDYTMGLFVGRINMEVNVPSGWYQDPNGFDCDRFWDGTSWTEQTRPRSILLNRAPPNTKASKVGLDSNEKALLVGIGILIILVALFSV
jgi:hypothetical protein